MKKLVKHGNSLAIVIDKPLLKILKITDKTNLEITIKDNTLIIKPKTKEKIQGKNREKEIDEIADRIMDKYAPVFRKLAKT